jgi:glucose-6-phosphate-specific signal transduction histidine kinase
MRQNLVGGMIKDCFSALMKSHVLYFARWVDVVNIFAFFAEASDMLALLLPLASRLVMCLQRSQWYANLSLTPARDHGSSFL